MKEVSSYRHTPKYRRPEQSGRIIVGANPREWLKEETTGLVDPLSYYAGGGRTRAQDAT